MAAYVELYIDQGATFTNTINITDDLTNDYVDITGYSVASQLRRSYYSETISGTITCTIQNAAQGEILMTMTAAQTAALKAGRYLFDVQTTDTEGTKSRILEGTIVVTPRITK